MQRVLKRERVREAQEMACRDAGFDALGRRGLDAEEAGEVMEAAEVEDGQWTDGRNAADVVAYLLGKAGAGARGGGLEQCEAVEVAWLRARQATLEREVRRRRDRLRRLEELEGKVK